MKEKEAFLEIYTIRKNNLDFKFNFRLIEKNILEKVSSEINFIYYFENIWKKSNWLEFLYQNEKSELKIKIKLKKWNKFVRVTANIFQNKKIFFLKNISFPISCYSNIPNLPWS